MEANIRELIERIKQGDHQAFEVLVKQYSARVSNTIYHILGASSDVDDLSQEVFIKVYKYLGGFNQKAKFTTWLYRITVNTVYDYLRKMRHRKAVSLEELEPEEPGRFTATPESVTRNVEQQELQQLLHKLIQELPVKYRTVLVLKDIEGFTYQEIAGIMKCSLGTVESRLYRARMALRDKLKKSPWGRELQ